MKIDVSQGNLADALGVATRTVALKSTLPVLGNVMLNVADGKLTVAGNNLEMASSSTVECTMHKPGRITLPARLLADYVMLLDSGQTVTLELNPKTNKVHLECGRFTANIAGIDAEDWPPIPAANTAASFLLEAGPLKNAVDQVVFAAAPDESRPVLAGVMLRITDNLLVLAAADGFRLSVHTIQLSEDVSDVSVIIPAKALVQLAHLLPSAADAEVTVSTATNATHIGFAFGGIELTSRLIEGTFPDFARIVPTAHRTMAVIDTSALLRATRAASVFARDNSHIVRLVCTPETANGSQTPGSIVVKSTSAESGDNTGTLEAVVTGEIGEVAFNAKYLRDALEAIESAQVQLTISGASSPGMLQPTGNDDDSVMHVIMPMHVAR